MNTVVYSPLTLLILTISLILPRFTQITTTHNTVGKSKVKVIEWKWKWEMGFDIKKYLRRSQGDYHVRKKSTNNCWAALMNADIRDIRFSGSFSDLNIWQICD